MSIEETIEDLKTQSQKAKIRENNFFVRMEENFFDPIFKASERFCGFLTSPWTSNKSELTKKSETLQTARVQKNAL